MFTLKGKSAGSDLSVTWDNGMLDPPQLEGIFEGREDDLDDANSAYMVLNDLFDERPEFSGDELVDFDEVIILDGEEE